MPGDSDGRERGIEMPKFVMGIDPGLRGGIAVVEASESRGHAELRGAYPMPLRDGEVYGESLWDLLEEWKPKTIAIEKVHAMPKQGVVSMFTFGKGFGIVEGVARAWVQHREPNPIRLLAPREWQKAVHLPGVWKDMDAKGRSALAVDHWFPGEDWRATARCKKRHDGMIDAALIALAVARGA